jgi:methyltransferase (TIGR00027 family)
MRNEPSRTAEAVCLFRASDQRRPEGTRIVDDPYARFFLGPLMRAALAALEATGRLGELAEEYSPGLVAYVLARHRFMDDALSAALAAKRVSQVVLLGAGYDTRAHRFAHLLDGRPVFELDFPATSRRKRQIAEERSKELPAADIRRVEIDFLTETIDGVLERAGFRRGEPTFVVWEGVSMYLTRAAVKATLGTIRALGGPGSELVMDFWFMLDDPGLLATALRMSPSLLHFLGEPMTFGIHPEDAGDFFRRLGWDMAELADPAELERRYVKDDRRVYPACFVARARHLG